MNLARPKPSPPPDFGHAWITFPPLNAAKEQRVSVGQPPLPRPVTGVFVRQIIQTACPGHFAVVWLDALPPPEGVSAHEAVEFVDALPTQCHEVRRRAKAPLPAEFVTALENGFRQGWRLRGDGTPPYTVRVLLRDALWHDVDSNRSGFEQAGRIAAGEVLECVRQGRAPRQVGRGSRPERPIPPMPRLR